MAQCNLLHQGLVTYTLSVEYAVLSEAVFEKLFRAHAVEPRSELPLGSASHRINPYSRTTELTESQRDAAGASGTLAPVTPEHCLGHFPRYPMLPVAMVMQSLSALAGKHLSAPYTVERAEVVAENLAPSGSRVHFEAVAGEVAGDFHTYVCRAQTHDGKIVGTMKLVLRKARAGPHAARYSIGP